MNWPEPTRQAHQQFCVNEGWRRVRNARGKTGDHVIFELDVPDGRILRTRVSHPPNRDTYGPGIWSHILRDQLDVSEAEFWACVRERTRPQRGVVEAPKAALPLEIAFLLVQRVGLSENEVGAMTKEQAVARIQRFWTEGA